VDDQPGDRELDVLLSTGEIVSSTLLAMALKSLGYGAISLSGAQAGIRTDTAHSRARILRVDPQRIVQELERGNVVIVAGGVAFTTLRSLINYILHPENRARFGELTVIYGARSPGELIYKYDLDAWGQRDDVKLHVTVDAGDERWTGLVGYVPTILKEAAPSSENAVAVVCGPPIMIKFSLPVLEELGFPPDRVLNSLEMRMKCGIGKCGRCNIGEKYVCKDGPVFTLEQLQKLPSEY